MLAAQKLSRVILIDMQVGPQTTTALLQLNKSRSSSKTTKSFAIDFRNCNLVGFEERYPDMETEQHPMISHTFAPVRFLTLADQKLQDGHL